MLINFIRAYVLFFVAEIKENRNILFKYKQLQSFYDAISFEDRKKYQKEQLLKTLNICKEKVPYYRELFLQLNIDVDSFRNSDLSIEDILKELPLLDKTIIQQQGIKLINEDFLDKIDTELYLRKSNGSTGLTTNIWYDSDSLDVSSAHGLYSADLYGKTRLKNELIVTSPYFNKLKFKDRFILKLKGFIQNREYLCVESFDDNTLLEVLEKIKKKKINYVYSFPSIVFKLAVVAEKYGLQNNFYFSVFVSDGETLDNSKLTKINNVFKCKIVNRYGCAEFGVVAQSKPGDCRKLMFFDQVVIPESISLGNGLEEVVLTGLFNPVMPLIRYRTGDVGSIKFCENGYELLNLGGRIHDFFIFNNKLFSSLELCDYFNSLDYVLDFQIVIDDNKELVCLKMIVGADFSKSHFEQALLEYFNFKIEYSIVSELQYQTLGWREKFTYIRVV